MKKFTERIVSSVAAVAAATCILTTFAPASHAAALTDRADTARQKIVISTMYTDDSGNTYTLTVDGVAESHADGDIVQLSARFYNDGQAHRFSHWSGDTYLLSDSTAPDISITMPQSAVTLYRNYVIVGDANGDGRVTVADVNTLMRMVSGTMAPTLAGDINLDGKWDNEDVALLKKMLVGSYVPTK